MADRRQLELIHAELDGELDAGQRAELARSLLADPQTQALREQLRRLCRALDSLDAVEPPAQFRESILAALPQSSLQRPRRYGSSATRWRYAAMLAGVLAAGVVVFGSFKGSWPAATDVAGTIAASSASTAVDSVALGNGPVSGRVSLHRDRTGLSLELEVRAGAPVDVRIASEGHTLEVNGLDEGKAGGHPTLVALPGFGMDGQSVELTFLMGGQSVGSATLRAPRGE